MGTTFSKKVKQADAELPWRANQNRRLLLRNLVEQKLRKAIKINNLVRDATGIQFMFAHKM